MKKLLLAAYIFFFTGGCFAQDRKDTVVAELDFNKPTNLSKHFTTPTGKMVEMDTLFKIVYDTVRASLLVSKGPMTMAHEIKGYVVYYWGRLVTYLDDRKRLIKPPITVWGMKAKEGKP